MRLRLALEGDLRKALDDDLKAGRSAVADAMEAAGVRLKDTLRAQVAQAGLGSRLANAIRSQKYPIQKDSLDSSALVWTKSPKIFDAFERGVMVMSGKGFFLAIPTEHAPRRGTNGLRIRPSNFPEEALGKLRFVKTADGKFALVVDNMRMRTGKKAGKFMKGSATAIRRKQVHSVVMFILVPAARLTKRLDFEGPARAIADSIPGAVAANWDWRAKR